MHNEPWQAALRLHLTPGLGLRRCQALYHVLGSCQHILEAPDALLRDALGTRVWSALRAEPPDLADSMLRIQHWLRSAPVGLRHTVLHLGDPGYPPAFAPLPDPPLLLFVVDASPDPSADPADMNWPPGVALVGSRGATPQGISITRQWAHQLAEAGWCVVSGMAHGIDAAAHWGALQSVSTACATLAVMGTGPDLVYPPAHAELKARIAQRGRLITEHLPGMRARKSHFPMRNRLVAALSQGVVVIEADLGSGSLISAQCALEQGREVMAVPGSIRSPLSRGCHALLRQGATLVENVADVLAAIQPQGQAPLLSMPAHPTGADRSPNPQPGPELDDLGHAIRQAMGHDPVAVDLLLPLLPCAMPELRARLQTLELQGCLARLPGDRVQWVDM